MLNLNPHQEAFASWDPARGNLRVQASAGAGKTAALVEFVARQIAAGVPAEAVVVLTFTNKAAGELRERIMERLGRLLEGLRMGTFHSIALSEVRASEDSWRYQSDRLLDGSGFPVEGRRLVTSLKPGSLIRAWADRGPAATPRSGTTRILGVRRLGRPPRQQGAPGWLLEGKSFDESHPRSSPRPVAVRASQTAAQGVAVQRLLGRWLILLRRRGKGFGSPAGAASQDGPAGPAIGPDPPQGHLVVVDGWDNS